MGTTKLDVEGMNNKVKPALAYSMSDLMEARNIVSKIEIPEDFSGQENLRASITDIENVKMNVKSIYQWATNVTTKFQQAEEKNKSILNNLFNITGNAKTKVSFMDALKNRVNEEITKLAKQMQKMDQKNNKGKKGTNAKFSKNYSSFFEKYIKTDYKKAAKGTKTVISDTSNLVISFVKGIGQLGEALLKTKAIIDTGNETVVNVLKDAITYGISKITGKNDKWKSSTIQSWKNTMSFVSNDYVSSAANWFYKKTDPGKWLNKNSNKIFKSDGIACEISSGIGYVSGTVGLSIITGGLYGAAAGVTSSAGTTAISAGIAGLSGLGKYTSEYWQKVKASWNKETDWRNLENAIKGFMYGSANGAWEGFQWYAGGKLLNLTLKTASKVTESVIKVGIDSIFNALDTPFRTTIDMVTSDKSWKEAWKDQGGWVSLITNLGVGLIGSSVGEIIDNIKNSKITGMNKKEVTELADNLEFFNSSSIDEFWTTNFERTKKYGVDQGIFRDLRKTDKKYYNEMKNKIMKKYNMSAQDTAKFMAFIDSTGACSYACAAGNIISEFRGNPIMFYKKFGFPLYRIDSEGTVVVNQAELLADMYFVVNHENNGGKLFCTDINGKNTFTGQSSEMQKYMSRFWMREQKELNEYLKIKGIVCEQRYINGMRSGRWKDPEECIEYIKKQVKESLENGENLFMDALGDEKNIFIYRDINKGKILARLNRDGHATTITGINDDGIIVSTWGKKALIRFEDLVASQQFEIIKRIFKEER